MHMIHMATTSTHEFDMKTKIKNTFTKDGFFEWMKTNLQQKKYEQGHELIQEYLLM